MILTKGDRREFNFDSFVKAKLKKDKFETILILVPTNRKLRETKKKEIDHYTSKTISRINIETLTTIATKILQKHIGFIPLSEAASTVLIKDTVEELDLEYFSAYNKNIPFGTLDKIKNVISEYKRHGISYRDLLEQSKKLLDGEKLKAQDIARIFELYSEKCNKLSAFDLGDIYSSFLQINKSTLADYFNLLFPNINTILLDEFDEFTNLEIDIIAALSELVKSDLILNFDYYLENMGLFSHLDDTFRHLEENGFKKILDKAPLESSKFKKLIKENLFSDKNRSKNNEYIDNITKYKAGSRTDEIEFIARSIKERIINQNIHPEDICVAFNVIGNYSNYIRDIFHKYGIPLNLTDRLTLKSSPPVVAAISLLELVENDFYYYDLLAVLTNGLLDFSVIDTNNLIEVAAKLKITGGYQNWQVSISDSKKLLDYDNEIGIWEKENLLIKLATAEQNIKDLGELLLPLKEKSFTDEFLDKFSKILLKLKLPCLIIDESTGKDEEFVKSISVFMQTLKEVLYLREIEKPNAKHSLSYYIENIKTISNWARYNVKEKSGFGVLVTSLNEIRGLKFKYLYLGGLCDGDLPTRYSPEIFFSGSYQKKEQIHQTEERYHFYQALSCWENKLYLSVPQKDSDSELIESIFVQDFEKLFEISNIDKCSDDYILSIEELLVKNAHNPQNEKIKEALKRNQINPQLLIHKKNVLEARVDNPFGKGNNYNGFIDTNDSETKEFLIKISQNQYSISQLELFAKCPFKYFTEKILKLESLKEPTEEAEPIELGNVLHKILYEFYTNVIENKIPIGKVGSKEFKNLQKLLFEIANENIEKLNLNSSLAFFEKEKILGIDGNEEASILFKFLEHETENEDSASPELFECSFGNFRSIENEKSFAPFEIGQLKLRGKIDRIDVDYENNLFNVVDYKLRGKKPTKQELLEGISLQLPVYLMAGEQILKELKNQKFDSYKMIIFSLDYKMNNFGPLQVKLSSKRKEDPEEIKKLNKTLLKNTKQKLIQYHENIKDGKFNLSNLPDRENKICRYCDFQSFCRVKEVLSE